MDKIRISTKKKVLTIEMMENKRIAVLTNCVKGCSVRSKRMR